jgi:UDP-N-acetylmuramoyl-tripeptide--D-alanyl-D-alanine ligase
MATPIPRNTATFDLDTIVRLTRGSVVQLGAAVAVGVSTDSRTVEAGGLFVALVGDAHDGHGYLATASRRGAAMALVQRGRARDLAGLSLSLSVVEVDDTLVALGELSRFYLQSRRPRVVAITGSAGKTTTKELTAALLGAVGPTHRTAGNLNNRIGLPSVVLAIRPEHAFVVLEMGMSLPGELDALTTIARPDVSIVTNVGMAHAEGVGGPGGIAHEKAAVYRALDENGIAIANADDALVMDAVQRTRALRRITFGAAEGADYRLVARELDAESGQSRVTIRCSTLGNERELHLRFPLVGFAAAIDLCAAIAAQEAATGVELTVSQMELALAGVRTDGRATVEQLGQDIVLLDDTYNANPASMNADLVTLTELAGTSRRRVVVLGEMKELGAHAESAHDALGEAIAAAGVSLAVGCGGLMDRALGRAAQCATRGTLEVVCASGTEQATREIVGRIRPGDAVLVKGSRSVGTERVVAALKEGWPNPEKSATQVVS